MAVGYMIFTPLLGANQQGGPLFSREEQDWIAAHPVIRVGVMNDTPPIEYMQGGRLEGLSAQYLAYVTNKTGLKFTFIPAPSLKKRIDLLMNNEIDLISAVQINGPLGHDPRLIHTPDYLSTTAVVITRMHHLPVLTTDQLNYLTVTLPYYERYKEAITNKAPNVKLIVGGAARKMLQQVANGEADAAVAAEAYLMPFLYREFQGQLKISGVLKEMTFEMGMSTRADELLLRSILQKAISSISADELRLVHTNWLHQYAPEDLPFTEIIDHYPHEVALATLLFLSLSALVWLVHRLRQRAVRNEREKTMFLAVMSHEIRSPMNAVLAAVELLRNTPLNKQQQHLADLANGGASSLLTLLNDVLDISKLDAGQVKLEFESVDVAKLVRNVVELQSLRAREKHLSLTIDGDPNVPPLMLDDTRLGQVLHNLISNAIKFTETGGVNVSFCVSDTSEDKQKRLHITVTDTGTGITKETQAQLFVPYAQAARTYKKSGGTGLGLTICRDLLKLMQGTISLSSVIGEGTKVELFLPVTTAAPTIPPVEILVPAAAPLSSVKPVNLRILVVEDTPANQAVLQAQIEGFGCTPIIAGDGAQAMVCFEHDVYDLVLMDCDLPDKDGYSLTTMFRIMEQDTKQRRCPIIAISASTDNKHIALCFDSGMDGILGKPISLGKLQDAIELWCAVELTLITVPFVGQSTLGESQIIETLEQDLHKLIEAALLGDLDAARHAAHRLHGAALSMNWPEVADTTKAIETLLHAGTPLEDVLYTAALKTLVHRFRTTSFVRSHP